MLLCSTHEKGNMGNAHHKRRVYATAKPLDELAVASGRPDQGSRKRALSSEPPLQVLVIGSHAPGCVHEVKRRTAMAHQESQITSKDGREVFSTPFLEPGRAF